MTDLVTIILAAGKGTRMKSALPKVLHKVCGKEMVRCVLDTATSAGSKRNIVVVGFGADEVRKALDGAAEHGGVFAAGGRGEGDAREAGDAPVRV